MTVTVDALNAREQEIALVAMEAVKIGLMKKLSAQPVKVLGNANAF